MAESGMSPDCIPRASIHCGGLGVANPMKFQAAKHSNQVKFKQTTAEVTFVWLVHTKRKLHIPSEHPNSSTLNVGYPWYVFTLILINRAIMAGSRM